MASTYFARAAAVTNAINKKFMTLYNASGSGVVVRIYRVWIQPFSTASVTGGIGTLVFDKFSGVPGGGAAITCTKLNTANASVSASVTALNGNTTISGTLTSLGELFRLSYSNDEPAAGAQTIDEFRLVWPLAVVREWGVGDSDVEPLVLREAEGFQIYSLNAGTWGASTIDIVIQFTIT
jgi:hypothetical protein